MHIGYVPVMLLFVSALSASPAMAQDDGAAVRDSARTVVLDDVVVRVRPGTNVRSIAQPVGIAGEKFLREYFTGNLTQTLQHIPGVRSMDIGSGFSKPVIRGMGFNRITVAENGIKQEGQQWGADHGLEIDAFGVESVVVRKGPSSLLYGSDAMGGAIEITRSLPPVDDQLFGEAALLGRSVNGTMGGSVMLGLKRGRWYTKARYSEQRFGDYRIPADTVVYLTHRLPVAGGRLKNTAGWERDAGWLAEYRAGRYYLDLSASNAYQKVGFFAGAHGMPSAAALADDGDPRNVALPFSTVNHLKVALRQRYAWDRMSLSWDAAWQNNHRLEWSRFHTHYGSQPPPAVDPDKELEFTLNTLSSSVRLKVFPHDRRWEHTAGWDVQWQRNTIGGYSFLLPAFRRLTSGVLWLTTWRVQRNVTLGGGIRYDRGRLDAEAYSDPYLENYLARQGYSAEQIALYRWRSYAVDRRFGDVSGSLGVVWTPRPGHTVRVNAGRSFRLPGANELASNGVHHGTFRHEQGTASLGSERGWQLDASYAFERRGLTLSLTPFASWFSNYIYLKPTGMWSILPHAGQIYRYTGAEAAFAGAEVEAGVDIAHGLNYRFTGEYVLGRNLSERIPLPFSPPASMRNTLTWSRGNVQVHAEMHTIAAQRAVSRNEDPTPGATLWNAGATLNLAVAGTTVEITLAAMNILDTRYYNHMSFYRRVEIPEPGRNFQILIKIPFKTKLK